jgi:RNA polymerase sigma-70 factor
VRVPVASPALDGETVRRLYDKAGADRWAVDAEAFEAALARSAAHRFATPPDPESLDGYLSALHVADLALAVACIDGHDEAWEHFIRELRPQLYAAARTIAGDEGRELADSLYADLFGLAGADGRRKSLLAHYHGRSRLLTWLRSVLIRRHIDRLRVTRRLEPLPDDEGTAPVADRRPAADPERDTLVAHAQAAVDAAIDALAPKDRLRLRMYYGQDMTLAAIGRVLGEHEATVSRKLEKGRSKLRQHVERTMAERGLRPAAIARAFELAADAPDLQLDRLLARAQDG